MRGILIALVLALFAPVSATRAAGDVVAGGAFTCDFVLSNQTPLDKAAGLIERDRIYMTRRPGMMHKHIPIVVDPSDGAIWSGGRYLFDTFENARAYRNWVFNDFVLDGIEFLHRPYFLHPDCHAWETIGAHDFGDIYTSQVVMRTERWDGLGSDPTSVLTARWPAIRDAAASRGYSSVWLLYSPDDAEVAMVYFKGRATPGAGTDALDLALLQTADPLGAAFADQGWHPVFDRTQFVLTIWFPNPGASGDNGQPSLWPNSPVLPQPSAMDGVCEPNRAEDHSTAPNDCTPHCGDGVTDADENNYSCPSDVPAS